MKLAFHFISFLSQINIQATHCAIVSSDVNRKATLQKEADTVWTLRVAKQANHTTSLKINC